MITFIKLLISNIKNWKKVLITIIVSLFISISLITGLIILLGLNRIILISHYYTPSYKEEKIIPYEDILRLKQWCPVIDELGCIYHGGHEGNPDVVLLRNKKKAKAFNYGVSEGLKQAMGFKIKEGKFIEAEDEGKNVCVLTEWLANKLDARVGDIIKYDMDEYDEKGKRLKERRYYFKVKGIITIPPLRFIPVIDSRYSLYGKDVIYVPVMTKWHLKLFYKTYSGPMDKEERYEYWNWGTVYMKVKNVNRAIVEIENFLKAKYGRENMFLIHREIFY